MIRIRIQSVGEVEVLALSSAINRHSTVLVDLGDGFRDRYVTWTLTRKDTATCVTCNRQITNLSISPLDWHAHNEVTTNCGAVRSHEPHPLKPRTTEFHAHNGHYYSRRMQAEMDFEKRAGFRADHEDCRV